MSVTDKPQCTTTSCCCAQVAEPYPTALLIRERALIVNMESVRMIICKDQCFVSIYSTCLQIHMLWHEPPVTWSCQRCAARAVLLQPLPESRKP